MESEFLYNISKIKTFWDKQILENIWADYAHENNNKKEYGLPSPTCLPITTHSVPPTVIHYQPFQGGATALLQLLSLSVGFLLHFFFTFYTLFRIASCTSAWNSLTSGF